MPKVQLSQAERVIFRFGGARRLARALTQVGDGKYGRNPSTVYRWTYPRARGGSGGVIPSSAIEDILAAARLEGVFLTAEDLYPGVLAVLL